LVPIVAALEIGDAHFRIIIGIVQTERVVPNEEQDTIIADDAPGDSRAADAAVDARRVGKTFKGRVRALDDVALRVPRGEIFGLLGPNGAGKSTLVKILLTIVRTPVAQGSMLGAPIGDRRTLSRVGYLPEHLRFPEYLTAAQALDFVGGMQRLPRRRRRRRSGELLDTVGLGAWASKRVGQFSKGMKQRLGVAQALINDPELVILDEPTDGVDPVGRRDIRRILVRMREEGRTVLLNSHLLGEVELVCDRVAILVQGRLRAEGGLDELAGGGARYELEADGPSEEAARDLRRAFAADLDRGALPDGPSVSLESGALRIGATEAREAQPALDAARRAGLAVKSFRLVRPTLEDLFISAVTDPETGRALEPGAERPARRRRRRRAQEEEA